MDMDVKKLKVSIEGAPKIIASVSAIFYFLGFLISIIHYGKFGILAIDFLSAKYILVGGFCVWYTSFLIFGVYFAEVIKEKRELQGSKNKYSAYLPYFLTLLSFSIVFTFSLSIVSDMLNIPYDSNYTWKTIFGLPIGAGLIFIIMGVMGFINVRTAKPKDDLSVLDTKFFESSIIMFCIAAYIFVYSYFIYCEIPTAFGGGKSNKISVILKGDKDNRDLRKLLCSTDTLNNRTKEAFLISETATDFYLRLSDTSSLIILPKQATNGVVFNW
jgi:hypothetical protein